MSGARTRDVLRKALTVIAVLVVLAVVWWSWDLDAMLAWQQRASPVRFFAAMAVLPAIGVPLTPLFILAGATFGPGMGLGGSLVALGLNLALCYWIASMMRPRLARLLSRFGYELPALAGKKQGALRFTLAAKLAPGVPLFVKNYSLGVAGVRFDMYFVVSMLTSGLYGALLILLGESLVRHSIGQVALAVAGMALLGVGVWLWRRRQTRDARATE